MNTFAVIGNISCDIAIYPDGRRFESLGGAALHVARAAAVAGLTCAPVSVVGADLSWIRSDPRLHSLDLSHVTVLPGRSCTFTLSYGSAGKLERVDSSFGVAESLTGHSLSVIGSHHRYHVCCRLPLDVPAVLGCLAEAGLAFSTDFHLASAASLIRAAGPFLPQSVAVFVNAAEFAILSEMFDPARLAAVVVSDGPGKVILLRHGRLIATSRPPHASPVEVTGAGDTLTGTFLARVACGQDDEEALRAAVVAATQSTRAPGLSIPHQ